MRIRIVSDLHFEFAPDGGAALMRDIVAEPFDVLVIAGDLTNAKGLPAALNLVMSSVGSRDVIYVHGNHEFYGSNREHVVENTCDAVAAWSNLYWADNSGMTINGQRFLGTPLWFEKSNAPTWAMTDFSVIDGYRDWVYEQNRLAQNFLNAMIALGDIVVTHHLPSEMSVAPQFKGNPLNPFFLCDTTDMIRRTKPRLWVHGHTHASRRYWIGGETEVVCNPYGYFGHEVNKAFDPKLTVEL